jgi:hypothetical protein
MSNPIAAVVVVLGVLLIGYKGAFEVDSAT